ncbi:MAG: hypothetical protein LBG94_05995 [Treponema sp.]|jgi:hypothetical protein|nr:hypothetical protein [Treponema sp.]
MKKLIAISVLFALVVGAAFAEATLGGTLQIGMNLLNGRTEGTDDDKEVVMGGIGFHEAKISAVFGDAKGGGKLVFVASDPNGESYALNGFSGAPDGKGTTIQTWGFIYWQPLPQFRMQIGINADGDFGAANITGWGFLGPDKNSSAALSDYKHWGNEKSYCYLFQSGGRPGHPFYPGTGDWINLNFSLFPVDGMRINFVFPMFGGTWTAWPNGGGTRDDGAKGAKKAGDQILEDFQINFRYAIEEVGVASLSFVARGGLADGADKSARAGDLYAQFYLNSITGIKVDFGLVYGLPWKNEQDKENDGFLGIGLGAIYSADPFEIKFRAMVRVGGKNSDVDLNDLVTVGLRPSYKINNDLIIYLYGGFNIWMSKANPNNDDEIGWFINPYIWVRASEGLRFFAGIQLNSLAGEYFLDESYNEKKIINWNIPFGFNFYF